MVEINSNKFEFDTQNEKCWYYAGATKMLIDDKLKSAGMFHYQVVFQLDEDNKDHWINYKLVYSGGKVWLETWYKKRIEDNSIPEGVRFVHYKKRIEKTGDIMVVEFDYSDEMVKVFDKQKDKDRYVNRLSWESQQGQARQ